MPDSVPSVREVVPLRRNRDFLILWSAEALSSVGTSMSLLVFPLIGYAITGSAVQAGLATTAMLLGGVATGLPAGALVDRWSRGRVLLLAYVAGAASYASLAAAALAHHLVLAHLITVGLITGTVEAFFAPAASAAVRTVVPQSQLALAYSRIDARQHAADLVGPPLGGALYAVARGLPFVVDSVTYGIAAISVTRLRAALPPPVRSAGRRSVFADITEGLRFVARQAVVRAILTWGALVNFSVTLVLVTVTLRLIRAGVHPAAIGLVDAIAAAAGLVGAVAAPAIINRIRTGVLTIVTGLVLPAIAFPMAWTTNFAVIGALLAVGTFMLPANNSGISAYMASVVPDHLQGRVNSAGGFIAGGVQPLAPALAGVLVGTIGGPGAAVIGAAFLALSLVPLLISQELRNLGRPDSWKLDQADAHASRDNGTCGPYYDSMPGIDR